jgi:hypothetical protein
MNARGIFMKIVRRTGFLFASFFVVSCSNGDGGKATTADAGAAEAASSYDPMGGDAMNLAGDDDHPPTTSVADLRAWLMTGKYKTGNWKCESAPHDPRSPSVHAIQNRICNNKDLQMAPATGEYPVGTSSVKELYDVGGMNVVGYAVDRHIAAGTTGATWFWFEIVPPIVPIPHDAMGVIAFGSGSTGGPVKANCVSCHGDAGKDANHSGHDFVYTKVP